MTLADEVDTQHAIASAKEAFKTFSQSTKAERIAWLEKIHTGTQTSPAGFDRCHG